MNDLVERQDAPVVRLPANASQEDHVFHALSMAIERGMDADTLQKMLDMQLQVMDRKNQQAFNKAMRLAQKAMPPVIAGGWNSQTSSKYAKLEDIQRAIEPVYTKRGFSCSFGQGECPVEGHIRVLCDVSHDDGHTRQYHLDVPIDTVGPSGKANKTATHGTISAETYGMVRLLRMIWNVRVVDDLSDDDGNAAGAKPVEYITEQQAADLKAFLEEVKVPESEFLKRQKCQSLEALPKSAYLLAIDQLQKRRKRMAEAGK